MFGIKQIKQEIDDQLNELSIRIAQIQYTQTEIQKWLEELDTTKVGKVLEMIPDQLKTFSDMIEQYKNAVSMERSLFNAKREEESKKSTKTKKTAAYNKTQAKKAKK